MKIVRIIATAAILFCSKATVMAQSKIDGSLSAITEIKPKAGFEKAVMEAATTIQAAAIKEPGCLLFSLNTREDDGNAIVLFEVFRNRAALDAHKKQQHTILFGKQLEGKLEYNKVTFLNAENTLYKQ
ncbi:MAG: antibiotic biosynthesis monooxygenase [Chitinophagaceae bacterium]